MKTRKIVLVAALSVITASLAFAADKVKELAKETHVTQDQLKWFQPFGPQGPNISLVEGQFGDAHPATFFVKFAGGASSPWHIHDENYQAVVVKGTFTEQQQGDAAETPLPAGTYFTQTAKVKHRNGCEKGEDCLVLVHFNKNANSKLTTPEGKLLPAPVAAKK